MSLLSTWMPVSSICVSSVLTWVANWSMVCKVEVWVDFRICSADSLLRIKTTAVIGRISRIEKANINLLRNE
ncbi:hypothetical protein D3C79_1080920 [compost metagenome]